MTGTCNMACWAAQEDVCRCMCHGANHGIMRHGGEQPGRFLQRKGIAFKLHGISAGWYEANSERRDLAHARAKAQGRQWAREEDALMVHATGHMLRWPEVVNFLADNPDAYLVFERT